MDIGSCRVRDGPISFLRVILSRIMKIMSKTAGNLKPYISNTLHHIASQNIYLQPPSFIDIYDSLTIQGFLCTHEG